MNQASFAEPQNNTIAITNVTVIDGNGGSPLKNATVIIEGGRISSVVVRGASVPVGAQKIDGSDKYLLPGFIDSNVHTSIYGNSKRRETVVKYGERNDELVLEFAQRQLKHGVTTVRDSYGSLLPVMKVRDQINAGKAIGPRILAAGNIVGWGGPFSLTFSMMQESELTLFQQKWNDSIALGAGEDLADMTPDELRVAINKYLDLGPNFIKYGGTAHFRRPSLIGFSPRAQKVIVDETHKRGLIAETHATSSESLRIAVEAGIDFIQHPEILSRDYPEYLIKMIVDRDVVCGIRSNTFIGKPLADHKAARKAAQAAFKMASAPKTSAERRAREDRLGEPYEIQLRNAKRLIKAGCIVSIATDNYQGKAPEFRSSPKPAYQEAGSGSILAIEGLVSLGMSEMEALVAGTKNGAIAAGGLDDFGTVEKGKAADLVLLNKNPLDDIRNIRELSMVMMGGKIIDIKALPEKRIFYTGK
jgi:imidazolonepropionase-like amidohydrolase